MAERVEQRCFHDVGQHAEEIAERAVRKVFAILGVDIDDPKQVEDFREDLRVAHKLRRAADHGFMAFVGIVVMAIATALWAGISAHLRH